MVADFCWLIAAILFWHVGGNDNSQHVRKTKRHADTANNLFVVLARLFVKMADLATMSQPHSQTH